MRGVTLLLSLLLLHTFASAQAPTAREVGDRLYSPGDTDLKQLLQQLDLPSEIVDYYSQSSIDGYKWLYLNARAGTSLNVLFLPCTSILGAPILLLERVGSRWHLRDQEGMDCHYDDSVSIQLASLTSRSQYDLLLHHDCGDRGSGYVEQRTRVIRIVGTRFKTVFDQPDVIHELPEGSNGNGNFEESSFLPLPSATLEQTRLKTNYDQNDQPRLASAVTTRRTFRWNGEHFIASPWQRLR